jgi:hypothetical protein
MIETSFIIDLLLIQILISPFLYAETHYRFKYFFSYLSKKEPEIVMDIPSRVLDNSPIPILVIIKDADKYPVTINSLTVLEDNGIVYSEKIDKRITSTYEDLIFKMRSTELTQGIHYFAIKIDYVVNGKSRTCFVDNHRGTSHKPLSTYISKDPLPRFENCFMGETHAHTNYTSDQVEFGATMKATRVMAKTLGLDFFCATDHSYDLDDYRDNYLQNDPDLSKWNDFKNEVKELNQDEDEILIIPGEEVTVRNKDDKNVHLLIYNSNKFFPGSGDSGERWFSNYSELSISQVLSDISRSSLAVSAHPSDKPPFLQKFLINRGSWQSKDCVEAGLHGLQFINGGDNTFLINGKNLWIEQLLADKRLTGIAGNDAHGNFSRFRQIGFPFFTMRENSKHLFGKWFTGIYVINNTLSISSVLDALKSGNCYMTNGPALFLQVADKYKSYNMGEECPFPLLCTIKLRSNDDFGGLKNVYVYVGDMLNKEEIIYFQTSPDVPDLEYFNQIPLNNLPDRGYLRVEVETVYNYQALSNPIWFNHYSL